jgi:hypothetical protein
MIAEIDAYIEDRLKKIQYREKSIPVLSYIPEREKGKTEPPCLVYLRHEITIREQDKRPDETLWIPSEEQTTYTNERGEDVSGPISYSVSPYSTPVDILYEIVALSVKKEDNNYLTEMILQAFPPGLTARIGEHYPLFIHGKNIISDSLELPLYKTSFLMTVTDVWLDRLEAETIKSIGIIEPIFTFQ